MFLKVTDIQTIAEDIKKIRLAPVDAPLPGFEPGAHLQIRFADGRYTRRYSLVSTPENLAYYEIAVLRKKDNPAGSAWLHDKLEVGQSIELVQTLSAFGLEKTARHSILIAGGIGITPIYSFAQYLNKTGQSFEIHYAARTQAHMAFRQQMVAAFGDKLRLYFDAENTRMNIANILAHPHEGQHVYLCGPRGLIEHVRHVSAELGWLKSHVHFESFGQPNPDFAKEVEVMLELTGQTITVPGDRSVLEVAEEQGAWSSAECRRGECGKCAVEFSGGEVDHQDVCLTDNMRKTLMCPCVSRPTSGGVRLQL